MGYTHYFKQRLPVHPARWDHVLRDVQKLMNNLPTHSMSAGGYYKTEPLELAALQDEPDLAPILDEDEIVFDGLGELGHETFVLERVQQESLLTFCKTGRKPYDLVVCAVLIVVNDHLPNCYDIKSDGDIEDWKPAKEWASKVLGRPLFFPPSLRYQKRTAA